MNNNITIQDIFKRWQLILIFVSTFAFIAFVVSVMLPAKYQSDVSVIVIQEQSNEKVDAFGATKSAEFLSNIFTRVIYTTTFFNSVQKAPFNVRRKFPRDPQQREREWKKIVNVKKINNTGILRISVIDKSRKTAEETAKAIAYALTMNSKAYHGGGARVHIKLIDGPNTPLQPTLPRILPNTIIGGILGFISAIVYLYFLPNGFNLVKKTEVSDEVILNSIANTKSDEYNEDMSDVIASHFNNDMRGDIEFEENIDDEKINVIEQETVTPNTDIEELHKRISNFHKKK